MDKTSRNWDPNQPNAVSAAQARAYGERLLIDWTIAEMRGWPKRNPNASVLT